MQPAARTPAPRPAGSGPSTRCAAISAISQPPAWSVPWGHRVHGRVTTPAGMGPCAGRLRGGGCGVSLDPCGGRLLRVRPASGDWLSDTFLLRLVSYPACPESPSFGSFLSHYFMPPTSPPHTPCPSPHTASRAPSCLPSHLPLPLKLNLGPHGRRRRRLRSSRTAVRRPWPRRPRPSMRCGTKGTLVGTALWTTLWTTGAKGAHSSHTARTQLVLAALLLAHRPRPCTWDVVYVLKRSFGRCFDS